MGGAFPPPPGYALVRIISPFSTHVSSIHLLGIPISDGRPISICPISFELSSPSFRVRVQILSRAPNFLLAGCVPSCTRFAQRAYAACSISISISSPLSFPHAPAIRRRSRIRNSLILAHSFCPSCSPFYLTSLYRFFFRVYSRSFPFLIPPIIPLSILLYRVCI